MKKIINRFMIFTDMNLKAYIIIFIINFLSNYVFINYEKNVMFAEREFSRADTYMFTANGFFCMTISLFVYLFLINYEGGKISYNSIIRFKSRKVIWINECIALLIKTCIFVLNIIISSGITGLLYSDIECNFNDDNSIFYFINNGVKIDRKISLSYVRILFCIYLTLLFLLFGMLYKIMFLFVSNRYVALVVTIFLSVLVQVTDIINRFSFNYDKFVHHNEFKFLYLSIPSILLFAFGVFCCEKKEYISE